MPVRRVAVALAVIAIATAAAPLNSAETLAGRYSRHFRNGLVDGTTYWSDDVVEIVPVDPSHAYFNVALQFFNGHECNISGIAEARGDELLYTAPPSSDLKGCRFSIRRVGGVLRLDEDENGACRAMTCGARGGYYKVDLPWSSKRRITYMQRLTRSTEYHDALTEWHKEQ